MEDDVLHPEDEVIAYVGVPNEYMEPLNDPARNNMRIFLEYLDKCAREAADKAGRSFTGRATDLGDQIAQSMSDARATNGENQKLQFTMPSRQNVPLRPDLIPPAQRKAKPNPKLLAAKSAPVVSGKPQPRPIHIQGKDYDEAAGSNSSLS